MLAKQHIITDDEAQSIINELKNIQSDFEEGQLEFKASLEDIHLNIEARAYSTYWRSWWKTAYWS